MDAFAALLEAGDKEGAIKWIDAEFEKDMHSDAAAFCFANLMVSSDHPGPAHFILRHLASKYPKRPQIWQNLGRVYEDLDKPVEAIASLKKALAINPDLPGLKESLSSAYALAHKWQDTEKWARLSLKEGPTVQAAVNLGFALLSTGQYAEGWDQYNVGIGEMLWREHQDYGLPDWKGEKDAKVLFYAEQGLGDQLAFMSCVPDAGDLVAGLNVAPKLAGLIGDTFDCPVFGDQFNHDCRWVDSLGATHQGAMSMLPQHFRRDTFPGTPYLKTDPAKVLQWRALLDSLPGKLKIGIGWTGGSPKSAGYRHRNMQASDLMMDLDADYISLEYKKGDTPDGVHSFGWGTQGDLDHTAALVSCLDAVVCVPTTAYHLAGALGVPAYVLTPDRPHFHEKLPWWSSVQFLPRNKASMDSIQRELNEQNFHRRGRTPAHRLHRPSVEHCAPGEQAGGNHPAFPFATAYHTARAY